MDQLAHQPRLGLGQSAVASHRAAPGCNGAEGCLRAGRSGEGPVRAADIADLTTGACHKLVGIAGPSQIERRGSQSGDRRGRRFRRRRRPAKRRGGLSAGRGTGLPKASRTPTRSSGAGRMTGCLAEEFREVHALDALPGMLEFASPPPLPALCLWRFSIRGGAQMTFPAMRIDPNTCGMPMP
jgi:hypothetical protein